MRMSKPGAFTGSRMCDSLHSLASRGFKSHLKAEVCVRAHKPLRAPSNVNRNRASQSFSTLENITFPQNSKEAALVK